MGVKMMKQIFLIAILALFACAAPKQGDGLDISEGAGEVRSDVTMDTDSTDASSSDIVKDSGNSGRKGYAVLKFCVDDSANQTYKDGQIRWTGSFVWDKKTNTITYASSWLPTDGPFIPLYDDGPVSKGGHESEGAVAGDHKLCAQTYLKTDRDYTIEYGTLDEFDHWIWQGPNGTVDIPKDSEKTYDLGTQELAKFGRVDFRIALDTGKLNEQFKTVTPDAYDIYVKTSANSWAPVQLLDNGKAGDAKAGDGIFSFQQSLHLGSHDGLVSAGQHVQFVFMFVIQGMDIENGQEYKVKGNCAMDGAFAWTDAAKAGDFQPSDVVMERDSRGRTFNTAIIAGGGRPWCKEDADCFAGKCGAEGCSTDVKPDELSITGIQPNQGPVEGGTAVTISGTGFKAGVSVKFGDADAADVAVVDSKQLTCATPAHVAGKVDVVLKNTDDKVATLSQGFEFIEEIKPVTIEDAVLMAPLTLKTEQAVPTKKLSAKVKVKNGDHNTIQAQCGWGPEGSDPSTDNTWQFINATYENADSGYEVYNAILMIASPGKYAFTFRFKGDGDWVYADSTGTVDGFDAAKLGTLTIPQPPVKPVILSVTPDHGPTNADTTVVIDGHNFQTGAKIILGEQEITPDSVTDDRIEFTAPARALGLVSVSVKNPDGRLGSQPDAFAYVPVGTPVIDGQIDVMNGNDWDPSWKLAGSNLNTDVAGNELHALYVAFDSDNLYIGINGRTDADHYIIGYLDTDYTGGTGYRDMSGLDDNSGNGDLDDALSSTFVVDDDKFGADFGFGTLGMQSFTSGDDLANSKFAGWRSFEEPKNFYWKDGNVISGTSAVELSISLRELWGPEAAKVPTRHHIALVVVIANKFGNARVNQALPAKFESETPMILKAADLWIRPDNKH